MLITIIGESCVGKSTIANKITQFTEFKVFTGKDYLRLAKNQFDAEKQFINLLNDSVINQNVIFVIAEKEHLSFLPSGAIRVLVTAPLETIKERFAKRMGGNLPLPVAKMLENKHGIFNDTPHDFLITEQSENLEELIPKILSFKK